tara:strand:- start:678 stop:1505 length:828 start_codon:yes stop_codon:yes gene_type:complete
LVLKEFIKRSVSGVLFASILILAAQNRLSFLVLVFIFGLISLKEFNTLIEQKNPLSYLIFIFLFITFGFLDLLLESPTLIDEVSQIIHVVCIFVLLFLTRDLFSSKSLPKLLTNRYINTTFYISCGFIFLILISLSSGAYSSSTIIGMFILIWTNDSFAYIIGSNFGRQKLFESVSPKKTVEGFLGGLFFSTVVGYLLFKFADNLEFSNWLIISVIVSVFGTIGDLIESKYKRQANVKDSGNLLPGHGGLLDRMDSAIFIAPFIYLFIKILNYVS